VRVIGFKTREEAQRVLKPLAKIGFKDSYVVRMKNSYVAK
jgi:hypothetical protein